MQILKQNSGYKLISFEKARKNEYTTNQIKIMRDMKKAAIQYGWYDIYTGEKFSLENLPTIEHIFPCALKNNIEIKALIEHGFQLNGLDNTFPVGSLGNSSRGNMTFKKVIIEKPIILTRLLNELPKYQKYKSELINGEVWVKKLYETLSIAIAGISSDIRTRKLL